MDRDLPWLIEYMQEAMKDPFPRYIFQKEILQKMPDTEDLEAIQLSKWYRQLASEQWDDGSWGRFHTQDSKAPVKQRFVTTEAALCRAHELSLTKDDPMIAKTIKLLEQYVRGEETWTDSVEKHDDGGRGHLFYRPYYSAARLNMFDPENPCLRPLKNNLTEALTISSKNNFSGEAIWGKGTDAYLTALIATPSLYSALLLQNSDCMSDALQKQYLAYLWNKRDGIYYVSSVPPADLQCVEDRRFLQWLSTLELLSGFSLFPRFMEDEVFPHLICEMNRLTEEDIPLPSAHPTAGRYAENWRDVKTRKNDMILRILRIVKSAVRPAERKRFMCEIRNREIIFNAIGEAGCSG